MAMQQGSNPTDNSTESLLVVPAFDTSDRSVSPAVLQESSGAAVYAHRQKPISNPGFEDTPEQLHAAICNGYIRFTNLCVAMLVQVL